MLERVPSTLGEKAEEEEKETEPRKRRHLCVREPGKVLGSI